MYGNLEKYVWANQDAAHGYVSTDLYCGYPIMKVNLATFYITCDHFRDMAQPILALQLVFIGKRTHVEFANDVVHLHKIEW